MRTKKRYPRQIITVVKETKESNPVEVESKARRKNKNAAAMLALNSTDGGKKEPKNQKTTPTSETA
jgi:hypothetical protein